MNARLMYVAAETGSLQQIERPALPLPLDEAWVNTPIDAFILNKLRQNGMSPAPRSDKRTLLRRLSTTLLGFLQRRHKHNHF